MNPYRTVAFHTLGCKLNFSETSTIARSFTDAGYARVEMDQKPDVVVINTCSVTDHADRKCKRLVKQAKKYNPDAYVAIIGCYAQLKPQEIKDIPGVNMVLGANEKFNVLDHVEGADPADNFALTDKIKHVKEFAPSYSLGDRTRTFLKVQDGCDYFCSFCTIPLARGRSRSRNVEETLKTAREVAQTEAKEVVLTGVNIGDFGQGGDENFFGLIQELDKIEGVDRWRISSIEPNLLGNEIIDFVATSQNFVPHFHIPLQSGSDALLKKMRRKYLSDLYADRVNHIKSKMPDACIGVDVIVGFPGETDEEFMKTVSFLKNLDISYLHVFTYSERANTTAKKMSDAVPVSLRKERSKQLQILSEKKRRQFYETQLGKKGHVLFEAREQDGFISGFTANYVKVKVPYDPELVNEIVEVSLDKIGRDGNVKASVLSQELAS